jgi:hypothetical protein
MSYDRYTQFRKGNEIEIVPFGKVPKSGGDIYEIYIKGETRLDKLSYEYYNSPDYAWLILQANPQYGSLEFLIPDGAEVRIPFPLDVALEGYDGAIREYDRLYGIE